MANKYLNYITDDHLILCITKLHQSYINAKNDINKAKFYDNKVDTIKLTFDSKFNDIEEESLIETELLRQIDNSLFADIKNKHNTMNSSSAESLFQKLAAYADRYRSQNAKCYWVQILAKGSFNENWKGIINGKEYSHTRVFKISGDQFYALLTNQSDALLQLYKILPVAINDYLNTVERSNAVHEHSAISEIKDQAHDSNRSILDQITLDNFGYYLGFNTL